MLRRAMVTVLALALLAAACGDDDGGATTSASGLDGAEQALANVMAASISEDADPTNPFGNAAAAQCISEGAVGQLGIARLAEIGFTVESGDATGAFGVLTDDEIGGIADVALGCIDVDTAMADQFATDGISRESALCMSRAFGETDFYRDAFIAGFGGDTAYDPTGDPEFLGMMVTIATECLTQEELGILMGG